MTNKIAILMACLACVAGCSKRTGHKSKESGEVLVTIGDRKITQGEFAERLKAESPYIRAQFDSPERRRVYLDNWIQFELLATEAESKGFDERPEVQQAVRTAMAQALIKAEIEEKYQLSSITDDEVKAYYEKHKDEFNRPEQRMARQIVVADKANALSMIKTLKAASPQELSIKFNELAREKSIDAATKDRGGDLGPFAAQGEAGPAPEVRKAVYSAPEANKVLSEPVKTAQGYHVIYYQGNRPAMDRSLDSAISQIRPRLLQEKKATAIKDLIESLRKKTPVKIDEKVLASMASDSAPNSAQAPRPVGTPGSR